MACWCGREQVRGICPLHGLAMAAPTADPEPEVKLALSDALSANITLSSSNTLYSGPGVTLAPGKWLVSFHVTFSRTTATAVTYYARIASVSASYASGQQTAPATADYAVQIALSTLVTVSTETPVWGQGATSSGSSGSVMRYAISTFLNTGATQITAVQLA